MRLWAIQLQVASGPAKSITYPQVVVEADDAQEAGERARERVRQENFGTLRPEEIVVKAATEIGLENVWIFNDPRFRNIE